MINATSWNCCKFICRREAFVSVAYRDGGTDENPRYSIAFGNQTPIVRPGDRVDVMEGFRRQLMHLQRNDITMNNLIKVPINQFEWDATASLFYQNGSKSLRHVAALFNTGAPIWGIIEFAKWSDDDAYDAMEHHEKINEGLAKRRVREMSLAVDGNYGDITEFAYYDGLPKETPMRWMNFPDAPPSL